LRYLQQTTIEPVMKISKKQAILQSLENMSPSETEELLSFIRGLLYNPANDMNELRKKTRGIREIRNALKESCAF